MLKFLPFFLVFSFSIYSLAGGLNEKYSFNKPSRKSVVGDVNNDGENELIIGTTYNNSHSIVTVYKFNGNDFDSLWSYQTVDNSSQGIFPLIADVDSDNENELIISINNWDHGGDVKIFEYSGSNNWQEAWSNSFSTIRKERAVSVGDTDNDGKNELVIGVDWYGRTMKIFEHIGENNYQESWSTSGNDFRSTMVGDCDNDGLNEILVGTGNWTWFDWRVYEWAGSTYDLTFNSGILGDVSGIIGDANNDGQNEVIVASDYESGNGENNLKVYHWDGSNYQEDWSWDSGLSAYGCALGELLYNNKNQIALFSGRQGHSTQLSDSSIHVFEFDGNNYVEVWKSSPFSSARYGDCQIGDVDNDNLNELIFSHPIDGVFIYGMDSSSTGMDTVDIISFPSSYELLQNFPNPFNPSTSIQYAVSSRQFVSLKIYDILGNEIATLVNEEKLAGTYEAKFDSDGLTSGVYFYQLQAGTFVETKKMILLK